MDFRQSSKPETQRQPLSNTTKHSVAKFLAHASPSHLGEMDAIDVFSDGSFYLLDAPGHSPAHIGALARTKSGSETNSEFVLLAGDALDHGGALRPSKYCHIPHSVLETTNLSPRLLERAQVSVEGTSVYAHPFLLPEAGDYDSAVQTLERLAALDARADVLTICAHEKLTEADGIAFFPKQLNGWRERNARDKLLWRFLKDFK